MKKIIIESFGWIGTIAIVGAYALSSFGVLSTHALLYQVLNIFGSVGIVSVSLYKRVYQTAALNGIWMIVGIIAVISILR